MENIRIKPIESQDIDILEELLYEAIFQEEGTAPLPKDIIHTPEIWEYIRNFGEMQDDYCFTASIDSEIIGAVWVRIMPGDIKGYGNIDDSTPEFAISIFPQYRGVGIGTQLMETMIKYLKENEYLQASLSVDKKNYAVSMYLKLGFEVIKEKDHDYLMVLKLN